MITLKLRIIDSFLLQFPFGARDRILTFFQERRKKKEKREEKDSPARKERRIAPPLLFTRAVGQKS